MPITTTEFNSRSEEHLNEIVEHLRRLDRRDRLRTWGGLIKALLSLIPMIIFLWSLWYFANHADEILKKIANEAASSAAKYTQQEGQGMLDELEPVDTKQIQKAH